MVRHRAISWAIAERFAVIRLLFFPAAERELILMPEGFPVTSQAEDISFYVDGLRTEALFGETLLIRLCLLFTVGWTTR